MSRDLDELRATLATVPTRAPWSAYLRKHFDEFNAAIGDMPKDWAAIAAWARDQGHHTGDKPLTAAAAKKAYDREYLRRYGKRRKPAAPVMPVPPSPTAVAKPPSPPPVQMLNPDGTEADPLAALRRELNERSGRPPHYVPEVKRPMEECSPQTPEDVSEAIRKLKERMRKEY